MPRVRPVLADPPFGGQHLVVHARHLTVGGEEVWRRGDGHEVACVMRWLAS